MTATALGRDDLQFPRTLFTQITRFKEEPYVPSLILKVLDKGNEAILLH